MSSVICLKKLLGSPNHSQLEPDRGVAAGPEYSERDSWATACSCRLTHDPQGGARAHTCHSELQLGGGTAGSRRYRRSRTAGEGRRGRPAAGRLRLTRLRTHRLQRELSPHMLLGSLGTALLLVGAAGACEKAGRVATVSAQLDRESSIEPRRGPELRLAGCRQQRSPAISAVESRLAS